MSAFDKPHDKMSSVKKINWTKAVRIEHRAANSRPSCSSFFGTIMASKSSNSEDMDGRSVLQRIKKDNPDDPLAYCNIKAAYTPVPMTWVEVAAKMKFGEMSEKGAWVKTLTNDDQCLRERQRVKKKEPPIKTNVEAETECECLVCGYIVADLEKHQRFAHTKARKCKLCGKVCYLMKTMKKHLENQHRITRNLSKQYDEIDTRHTPFGKDNISQETLSSDCKKPQCDDDQKLKLMRPMRITSPLVVLKNCLAESQDRKRSAEWQIVQDIAIKKPKTERTPDKKPSTPKITPLKAVRVNSNDGIISPGNQYCAICSMNTENLAQHKKDCHSWAYQCRNCKRAKQSVFFRPHLAFEHVKQAHNLEVNNINDHFNTIRTDAWPLPAKRNGKEKCIECNMWFTSLPVHMKKHTSMKCRTCSYYVYNVSKLVPHASEMHSVHFPEDLSAYVRGPEKETTERFGQWYEPVERPCVPPAPVIPPRKVNRLNKPIISAQALLTVMCEVCKCPVKNLSAHMEYFHETAVKCRQCKVVFYSELSKNEHVARHHNGIADCEDLCSKELEVADLLLLKNTCDVCGERTECLPTHMKTRHKTGTYKKSTTKPIASVSSVAGKKSSEPSSPAKRPTALKSSVLEGSVESYIKKEVKEEKHSEQDIVPSAVKTEPTFECVAELAATPISVIDKRPMETEETIPLASPSDAPEIQPSSTPEQASSHNSQAAFTCKTCGSQLNDADEAVTHLNDAHNISKDWMWWVTKNDSPSLDVTCDICNGVFKDIFFHKEQLHNMRFKCNICEKVFDRSSKKSRHFKMEHQISDFQDQISAIVPDVKPATCSTPTIEVPATEVKVEGRSPVQHTQISSSVAVEIEPCAAPSTNQLTTDVFYECNICDKLIESEALMTTHLRMEHKVDGKKVCKFYVVSLVPEK